MITRNPSSAFITMAVDKPTLAGSVGILVPDSRNAVAAEPEIRVAGPKSAGRIRISRGLLKKGALVLAGVAGVFGAADYGRYYWTTGRYLVTTDDAYVGAHAAHSQGSIITSAANSLLKRFPTKNKRG